VRAHPRRCDPGAVDKEEQGGAPYSRPVAAPRHANWFAYFPQDYRWSAALAGILGTAPFGGADLGEVDRVGRRLRDRIGDDDAWFDEWTREAGRVQARAEDAERAGRRLTAAAAYLRACGYYQMGERFRTPKDDRALAAFRAGVRCFHRFAALTDRPRIDPVEVPFERTSLPGYLVHAENAASARPPCVVYFDGLDITKELQYLRGVPDLVRRGISCLVLDGPGNGETIRFRGVPLRSDYEAAGSAALDYLEGRSDVDARRAGVMGISLGGYYAPRCAALEPRFGACVAWGAIWDYQATWRRRAELRFATALSVPGHHIAWVLGVRTIDEALARLADFRLQGVVERIRCPFLLLHGAEDEQVPVADARALFDAVGSEDKTLRIFTADEGGAQHCQTDQLTIATTTIADWLQEKL
jgi:dienelactone hydrolase